MSKCNLAMSDGIVPLMRTRTNCKTFKLVRFVIVEGMGPFSLGELAMVNTDSAEKVPMVEGKIPVMFLFNKDKETISSPILHTIPSQLSSQGSDDPSNFHSDVGIGLLVLD